MFAWARAIMSVIFEAGILNGYSSYCVRNFRPVFHLGWSAGKDAVIHGLGTNRLEMTLNHGRYYFHVGNTKYK